MSPSQVYWDGMNPLWAKAGLLRVSAIVNQSCRRSLTRRGSTDELSRRRSSAYPLGGRFISTAAATCSPTTHACRGSSLNSFES